MYVMQSQPQPQQPNMMRVPISYGNVNQSVAAQMRVATGVHQQRMPVVQSRMMAPAGSAISPNAMQPQQHLMATHMQSAASGSVGAAVHSPMMPSPNNSAGSMSIQQQHQHRGPGSVPAASPGDASHLQVLPTSSVVHSATSVNFFSRQL